MSCLSASIDRIGGISCEASFSREFSFEAALKKEFVTEISYTPEFSTEVSFSRDFTCQIGFVCTTSFGNEDVLWASDGMVFNVYGEKIYITLKS